MYDSVLFPTDGSPGAEAARDHAIGLAVDQEATLHVIHVTEVVSPAASLHDMVQEGMADRGRELVEDIAGPAREQGLTVRTAILEGEPAPTIVAYADAEGIDVVVMPTHGRAGVAKTVVGSVTDSVIRQGDVPVLVVKLAP